MERKELSLDDIELVSGGMIVDTGKGTYSVRDMSGKEVGVFPNTERGFKEAQELYKKVRFQKYTKTTTKTTK